VISLLRLQTKIPKKNPVQSPSDFSGANFRHFATKTIEYFICKKKCFLKAKFDPKQKKTKHFEKNHQTFETTKLDKIIKIILLKKNTDC
jgi:hypothetical protein